MKSLITDIIGGYDLRIDELETLQSNVKDITSALGTVFLSGNDKAVRLYGAELNIGMGEITVTKGAILYKPTTGDTEIYLVDAGSYPAEGLVNKDDVKWELSIVDSIPVVFENGSTNKIVKTKKLIPAVTTTIIEDVLQALKPARVTTNESSKTLSTTANWTGDVRYYIDNIGDLRISFYSVGYVGPITSSSVINFTTIPPEYRPITTQYIVIPATAGTGKDNFVIGQVDTNGYITVYENSSLGSLPTTLFTSIHTISRRSL